MLTLNYSIPRIHDPNPSIASYMYTLKIYGQHFFKYWLFSYLLQDEVSIISSQAVSQISRQGDAEFHSDTTVLNYGIEVGVWCNISVG